MIPVTRKAPNTCTYCRVRKQRCDRELPSCSRCAIKLRPCNYTWSRDASRSTEAEGLDMSLLFTEDGTCSADLTPRGRDELLQAFTSCTTRKPGSTSTLTELVSGIVDQANTTTSAVMEQHASSVHHWCPLMSEEMLQNGREGAMKQTLWDSPLSQVLVLCAFLLTRRTCQHPEHVSTGALYTTMKQILALVLASGEVSLDLFRAEMMLAVYEYAHGMAKQAHVTLSSCVQLLALIELDMSGSDHDNMNEALLSPLRADVIMLDRMIPLSKISKALPLAVPTKHTLCRLAAGKLEASFPPPSPHPNANSARKVHVRSIVALVSGRVLERIHALHRQSHPEETYDEVDAAAAMLIRTLLKKPQPYTWLHCDAIAMAFCSYLLLQQAQVQDLESRQPEPSQPDATKALIALHYARRMAWDMIRESIQKVRKEEDSARLPFARLSFVIRAAIAVFETNKYDEEAIYSDEELRAFTNVLKWFAARWSVGVEYVQRVEQYTGTL